MKVALYVSGDEESQLANMRLYCEAEGWKVTREYIDTNKKEEYRQLYRDAEKHKFDCVLFYSLSNFTTEGSYGAIVELKRLTRFGVSWTEFYNRPLFSTVDPEYKEIISTTLDLLGMQETIRIGKKLKIALDEARKKGKDIGRPRLIRNREAIYNDFKKGVPKAQLARVYKVSRGWIYKILSEQSRLAKVREGGA